MRRVSQPRLTQREYTGLAEFRHQIRRFLTFSEGAAQSAGIQSQQHQLLLAIQGLPAGEKPTVAAAAERLQIRHNSAVELADRCAAEGLIVKWHDAEDRRKVLLSLTEHGTAVLGELSATHLQELRVRGPQLIEALRTTLELADHIEP